MPVRARSFSEVGQGQGGPEARNGLSRASASHIRIPSDLDDGSESLSFGKKPAKRRKSDGLNVRLSRMLLRVNTSFITDLPAPGAKRPRNPSNGSSSSTTCTEIPQTPLDAVQYTIKSNNLGNDFAIIKAGSSPDKGRSGFLANKDLPSWRGAGQQKRTEKEARQRELPGWLSQTFSDLEPNHPLRALALTDYSNPTYNNSSALAYQEPFQPGGTSQLEETHDGAVFAFAPPVANFAVYDEDAPTILAAKESGANHSVPAAEDVYGVVDEEAPFDLPANGLHVDHHLLADDDAVYEKAQDAAEEFLPFAQPGPFAQKTVHFLTPDRSSPLSASNPASNRSRSRSTLSPATQPNEQPTVYNAFATPGPASHFSFAPLDHLVPDSVNVQNHSSDSLTLADDTRAEDDVFANTANEEDPTASAWSLISNTEHLQDKLFSTPGPVFCAPPIGYFDSPTEDPSSSDPAELACDNVELEIEQLLSEGQQRAAQKALRFIAREHSEMVNGTHAPAVISSNATSTIGDPVQEEFCTADSEFILNHLDTNHDAFEAEERAMNPMPPGSAIDTNTPAAIELFSSPPYIRFAHTKSEALHPSRSKPPTTRIGHPLDSASPYMRFDRLPSPTGAAYRGPGDIPALLCTPPRSQPPRAEKRIIEGCDDGAQVPDPAPADNSLSTDANVPVAITKPAIPEQKKPRRAFAPGPGVYLSPLHNVDDELGHSLPDTANQRASGDNARMESSENTEFADAAWNIGPSHSQVSDDSIEDWEV